MHRHPGCVADRQSYEPSGHRFDSTAANPRTCREPQSRKAALTGQLRDSGSRAPLARTAGGSPHSDGPTVPCASAGQARGCCPVPAIIIASRARAKKEFGLSEFAIAVSSSSLWSGLAMGPERPRAARAAGHRKQCARRLRVRRYYNTTWRCRGSRRTPRRHHADAVISPALLRLRALRSVVHELRRKTSANSTP